MNPNDQIAAEAWTWKTVHEIVANAGINDADQSISDAHNSAIQTAIEKVREPLLAILQDVYDEHMHFGWGYEELHDKIIETLGDKLNPVEAIIESTDLKSRAAQASESRTKTLLRSMIAALDNDDDATFFKCYEMLNDLVSQAAQGSDEPDPLLVNEGENSDYGINWLIAGASRCLEPIDTVKLAVAGFTDAAERISGARVALDKALADAHNATLAAPTEDTKRLDWLDENAKDYIMRGNVPMTFFITRKNKTLREAIDAAMKEGK